MHRVVRKGMVTAIACLALSGIAGTSAASAATGAASSSSGAHKPYLFPVPDRARLEHVASHLLPAPTVTGEATVSPPGRPGHIAAPTGRSDVVEYGAEITAESADDQQIVELGWTVAPVQFRDSYTHLFTSIWINGQFQGYGVDFEPLCGSSCQYGDILQTGEQLPVAIYQELGYWWVGVGGQWCGAYPDSLWANK